MKRKSLLKRIAHILSAALLIFGQVILPTNAAFAAPNDNNPARPGNDQPVWCMIVGYGWTAQLGGNNNNRFPLTQLPANADNSLSIGASGQVYAPNSSSQALKDKLDEYCATQYTVTAPVAVAVCGPNNDAITADAYMSITTDTGWINGSRTIKFTATAPYTFLLGGGYGNTKTVTYIDYNQACPETVITVPAIPGVNDPCGLNNATWLSLPNDTVSIDWSLTGGVLSASAKAGYVFSDGTHLHTYGTAPDSGILCDATKPTITPQIVCGPTNDTVQVTGGSHFTYTTAWQGNVLVVTVTGDANYGFYEGSSYTVRFTDTNTPCTLAIPAAPNPYDPCGLQNANWVAPADTATVHWSIQGGYLHASVIGNYIFTDGTTDHDYGLAKDSGVLCVTEKPMINPVETCGIKNDSYTVAGGTHSSVTSVWQDNSLVVTVKADSDYAFSDGSTVYTVIIKDKSMPCTQDVPPMPAHTDPCDDYRDINPPVWVGVPVDTTQYTWKLNRDRSYTVTATPGNVLKLENGRFVLSYTYRLPHNNYHNVCYEKIDTPEVPTPDYTCGPTSSADWVLPEDTETYTWKLVRGELWVIAEPGYMFRDGRHLVSKVNFGHASHHVKYQPCVIETPSYDATAVCGPENDVVVADEGKRYTVTVSDWEDGVKTISFKADKHFVFANGEKKFSVTYTDENLACPVLVAPTFDDMSCDLNDTVSYTIPEGGDDFYYTVQVGHGMEVEMDAGTYNLTRINQTITIRAYNFDSEEPVGTWAHTFTIPVCNVGMGSQKPVTQAVQELPQTGPEDNAHYTLIGFGLAVMTYAAVYFAQRRVA